MATNHQKYFKKLSLPFLVRLLLSLSLLINASTAFTQTKTKKKINIEEAEYLENNESIVANAQRLIGNVKLSHKQMVIFCDSAYAYSNSNSVDAFGHVHIINNDTLDMWAEYIHFDGDLDMAKARRSVKLKDPRLTLTTDSLDFNTAENIGYYNYGGTIVDSTNTLTSEIGRYYTAKNELFFTQKVVMVNKDYTLNTDTMTYFTDTEVAWFYGPTTINGTDTYFYSEKGWFNTRTNETEMLKNSTIRKEQTQLEGGYIFYNDSTGIGIARKNVVINDFENKMIITGHNATYNDFTQNAMMTDSAVWIQYYENDSLFLHADTLLTLPDTTAKDAKRLIAYNHARFYRIDIQGLCDSLIYFTKDSLIQLYTDPVLWSEENQLTADFIELVNKPTPPNEIHLNNNAFIVQELDTSKYNQIKGKNMVGFINDTVLYRIDVNGNGQSIYYPSDESSYIGLNKAESSNIIIYMGNKKINRITFVGTPKGTLSPMLETVSPETMLEGFKWRASERPINKFDIFGDADKSKLPTTLPESTINTSLPNVPEAMQTDEEKKPKQEEESKK
jgi:lipopolysaccharide export system protein LptA